MSDQTEQRPALNTDRELWREREGDYYADSLHVTQGGGIGINCGGYVFVKPIREWHRLAQEEQRHNAQMAALAHKWRESATRWEKDESLRDIHRPLVEVASANARQCADELDSDEGRKALEEMIAAAYEAAAQECEGFGLEEWAGDYAKGGKATADSLAHDIRQLIPADAAKALAKLLLEARREEARWWEKRTAAYEEARWWEKRTAAYARFFQTGARLNTLLDEEERMAALDKQLEGKKTE